MCGPNGPHFFSFLFLGNCTLMNMRKTNLRDAGTGYNQYKFGDAVLHVPHRSAKTPCVLWAGLDTATGISRRRAAELLLEWRAELQEIETFKQKVGL